MGSQGVARGDSRLVRWERRLWVAAAGWTLLIYSTLYFVRGPIEFLREMNLLRLTVAAVFLLTAATVVFLLARLHPTWRGLVVIVVFGLAYLGAILYVELPEEKLHFVEYGVLAAILFAAFLAGRERRTPAADRRTRNTLWAAIAAIALTSALGWIDEGIQAILPNRYYDLRDVGLNVAAALLAVAAMTVWRLLERPSS